ncbi:MAG: DNA translocase FtsK 4TM domain-containing protein [Candidatus Brocadiia bacterium]
MRMREISRVLIALFLALLGVFFALALLSYSSSDISFMTSYPTPRGTSNFCGPVGAWFSYQMLKLFGLAAYTIILIPIGFAILMFKEQEIDGFWFRLFGMLLFVYALASLAALIDGRKLFGLIATPLTDPVAVGLPISYGGLIGREFSLWLSSIAGMIGAILILIVVLFGAAVIASNLAVYEWTRDFIVDRIHKARQKSKHKGEVGGVLKPGPPAPAPQPEIPAAPVVSAKPEPVEEEPEEEPEDEPEEEDEDEKLEEKEPVKAPPRKKVPDTPQPALFDLDDGKPRTRAGVPGPYSDYKLPPITLFDEPITVRKDFQKITEERARVIEKCLADFSIEAKVVNWETGPVVTLFEIELKPGIKVGSVSSLADNLSMTLSAQSLRIIAPIPGKPTVGIELPNPEMEIVKFRELAEHPSFAHTNYRLPAFLGKQGAGEPLIADLTKMPHILIAGATGSGKSVCINALIMTLLAYRRPDEVKFILIDPKMVELSGYQNVPHLITPVVTDMRQTPGVLEWAVSEMEDRYRLCSRTAVRDIVGYNKIGADGLDTIITDPEEREKFPDHLPYIVIVVDELADLMMIARKEVEWSITRLAQKSRAIGIHIVLATQRPSVNVITGLIKANMPCRLSFQVSQKVDSRTILDQNGAEALLGRGDMLFQPPTSPRLIRAQGVFISDEEIKKVLEFIRAQASPQYNEKLNRAAQKSIEAHKGDSLSKKPGDFEGGGVSGGKRGSYTGGDAAEGSGGDGEDYELTPDGLDPLFEDAVEVVIENQRGSVSLLQRRLTVGYGRASRLIDQMEQQGILGPYRGSKPREILFTLEEWRAKKRGTEGGAK